MKTKSVVYKNKQDELLDNVLNILELDENNSFMVHDVVSDGKGDKVMDMIEDIKKYFCVSRLKLDEVKQPWLAVLKQIVKNHFEVSMCPITITRDGKKVKTNRYFLHEVDNSQQDKHFLVEKMTKIISLDNCNSFSVQDIDNDKNKQKKIMELSSQVKKTFDNQMINLKTVKRPWLTILKIVMKSEYDVMSSNQKVGDKMSKRYYFMKQESV